MKIKKSTIVWFAVAAFLLVVGFFPETGSSPKWKDATYVNGAVVLPENEGKLVAISGNLQVIGDAKDPVVGVSFPSPYVVRTVQQLKWMDSKETWELKHVYEGQSTDGFEDGTVVGRVQIGEFELEPQLAKTMLYMLREVKEDDFTAEDLDRMNAEGHAIPEDFNFFYSTGPIGYENLDSLDYMQHPEWDGKYLVSWKMWEPQPSDAATVVGVQKGNTLTYCELGTATSADKFMDEEAFKEAAAEVDIRWICAALALACAGMGVLSIVKGKGKNQDPNKAKAKTKGTKG